MKSRSLRFMINLGLLLSGSVMALSGLLIQFNYHMGNHGGIDATDLVIGISYSGWSDIHKISILFVSAFMVFHVIVHWKWYVTIIRKNLIGKNKQVIGLSIVFLLVAITGYIPWLVKLTGGEDSTRKLFIEIHDKIALILFVYLMLHVIKRLKWFLLAFRRLRNERGPM